MSFVQPHVIGSTLLESTLDGLKLNQLIISYQNLIEIWWNWAKISPQLDSYNISQYWLGLTIIHLELIWKWTKIQLVMTLPIENSFVSDLV
jgi:hypothetical protein